MRTGGVRTVGGTPGRARRLIRATERPTGPTAAAGLTPSVSSIPFVSGPPPVYEQVERISPLVRRVSARNTSVYTFTGTGTYLIGDDVVAVVDPGPNMPSHRDALVRALGDRDVSHIFLTHCHSDHSGLVAWLRERTSAPVVSGGPHAEFHPGVVSWVGGEDEPITQVVPDVVAGDGERFRSGEWTVEAVHTPGHTRNHVCYALVEERTLFTGDHIMGWSTSVVAPPTGDLTTYLGSLEKVHERGDALLRPTHGPPVEAVPRFVRSYIDRRLEREQDVLGAIGRGEATVEGIARHVYAGLDPRLMEAAAGSVMGHLIRLCELGLAAADLPAPFTTDTRFRLV